MGRMTRRGGGWAAGRRGWSALVAGVALAMTIPGGAWAATASSAAATTSSAAAASKAGALPAPPAGTTVVANNGKLRLAVNLKTGWFQVLDERSGFTWTSGPKTPTHYAHNTYWADVLRSQFGIERTTTQRLYTSTNEMSNQYTSSSVSFHATPITSGVQFKYSFANYNISFVADMVISGGHMTVTVPSQSVYESTKNGKPLPLGTPNACPRFTPPPPSMKLMLFYFPPECYQLTNVNFLPSFGAGVPGQSGYVVVPDGSGAKINFAKTHPIYTNEYDMPVYGDPTTTPALDQWLPQANMPVFGLVHSNAAHPSKSSAMLAVITKGASNAKIIVVPAGQRANLYLAYVNFVYRPPYDALGIGMTRSLKYSWKPITGTRQVTYYFLHGKQANYSGMALRFRNYLIQTQHAKPLKAHKQAPFLLRVMNGIREVGVLFDPFKAASTFAQTQQMLSYLRTHGVASIRATLEGWMQNGYQWKTLPGNWPPAGQLGGTSGLRGLAAWSSANRVQLAVETNAYYAWKSSNGFNPRLDALHQESQLFNQDVNGAFLISPDWARTNLLPPLQRRLQQAGVHGVDFGYLARNVYPNYQPQHVLTRGQAASNWMAMVRSARTLGTAGVQGGNTYAVGSASYFYNAPTTDSGFNYESSAIPFWEIAVHGLALYSGRESNLLSSPTADRLQMIEDGALPVWELTWHSASAMRFTNYNVLYSSRFTHWAPQAVQQYKQEVRSGYAALAYVAMTGSHSLAPGVHVTDYANGKRVIVNFNAHPVKVSKYGVTVPAQNYVVVSGGGAG